MNKSVLALSTALSIFAFTPAFAQNNAPAVDCSIAANASDPACANQQQNNATGTQSQGTTGTTTDQNAQGTTGSGTDMNNQNAQTGTGTGTGATTTTGSGADAAGQGTAQGSSTDMNNQNAQGTTTTPTTDQNAQSTTGTSGASTQQMSQSELIVPADQLNNAQVMSANDYIGKTVYDQGGNNIGEVNDMIISGDGNVEAVILGVGGFLGIGEKDVAVNTNAIQMVQDGDAQRLVVQASKEALEQAPSYDRANRRYADGMNNTTGTGTGTMDNTGSTTAPATTTDTTTGNSGGASGGGSNNNTSGTVDCTVAANASDPACVNQQNQQQ